MNDKQMKYCANMPGKYRSSYRAAMDQWRPTKAIRAKCLDCQAWQGNEVSDCRIETCPLWPYRMGRRPKNGPLAHRKAHTETRCAGTQLHGTSA